MAGSVSNVLVELIGANVDAFTRYRLQPLNGRVLRDKPVLKVQFNFSFCGSWAFERDASLMEKGFSISTSITAEPVGAGLFAY
ncbi:hypothetical protein [Pseudomonas mandelii]|uniref:Uncharacterized protein n=1 Tax=Pseudomonas mandelii TaxID=75612 RepID=A0A502HV09_9PSED|nr:hypothetical protein [Pseudomonas mandelii]TPG77186.1 hypothetical protein EAH74_28110 [Pseudomonas mandelii]